MNATYFNDVLLTLGSNIYFERTSIDDTESNVAGGTYRVKAINYNTRTPNARMLTENLPHAQSVFHGPTAIIGRNSSDDFVPLEDSTGKGFNQDFDIANVEWLIRTSPHGVDVRNQIGTYQVHANGEVNNFTLAALQTFPGEDNKLVLTAEALWSTWKDMFKDPSEKDQNQDNRYFVYNILNWFDGFLMETDQPVVLFDVYHTDVANWPTDYTLFNETLRKWGYDVRYARAAYTAGTFTDVDILVLSKMMMKLTAASKTALSNWWATGGKSILIAGDGDYESNMNATYFNDVLLTLGSNIYFERTSIDDTESNVAGGTYRVKAINYNTRTPNARMLTENLPHAQSVFHGPTAIIGRNSSDDFVPLEDSTGKGFNQDFDIANVEWLIRTSPHGVDVRNQIGTYQVHANGEVNNFTLAALQTFPGEDNKLVLTAEALWSTWKDMFKDPSEKQQLQNNRYFIWNVFNWMAPIRMRSFIPNGVKIDTPVAEKLFSENDVFLNWTAGVFNAEILRYEILVDGSVRNITGRMDFTLIDLSDGKHTLQVRAQTIYGFKAYSDEVNITVDTTAPVLAIVSPANKSTITEGDSITVNWTAIDASTAIANIEVFIDGVSKANQTTTIYAISTPSVGSHTVKIVATDTAGNTAELVFTFTVEATPTTPTTTTKTTATATKTKTKTKTSTTTSKGGPGFLALTLLITLGVSSIIIRRRRR
ncbi:MAG: Ig-like domain-containing protein [Promethearchaeota archaeon]